MPVVDLQDFFILCLDNDGNIVTAPIIDTGLSTVDYTFEWTETSSPATVLGTDSFYVAMMAGTYSVLVTDIYYRLFNCFRRSKYHICSQ